MAPFYGWGSTTSRLEPLRGDSLLFTTKFPEVHMVPQISSAMNRMFCHLGSSFALLTP